MWVVVWVGCGGFSFRRFLSFDLNNNIMSYTQNLFSYMHDDAVDAAHLSSLAPFLTEMSPKKKSRSSSPFGFNTFATAAAFAGK